MIPGLTLLLTEPLAAYVPPPAEPVIDYDELTPGNVADLVTLVTLYPFKKAQAA